MSKGAKLCGVTQSAASQHVQEVERRLGAPLLDRAKRPLELTPAGKLYADFCRDVMRRKTSFNSRWSGSSRKWKAPYTWRRFIRLGFPR